MVLPGMEHNTEEKGMRTVTQWEGKVAISKERAREGADEKVTYKHRPDRGGK